MKRALALVLPFALACGSTPPAQAPAPKPRVGTTVVTTCPDVAPALSAEGLETVGPPLGLSVERICVYGAGDESRGPLDRALAFRVGTPLAADAVRASLEALYATKLFDEPAIGAEARGTGAIVHVTVKERPRVEDLVVEGTSAAKVSNEADYGKALDRFRLHAAALQIENEYRRHGYGAAKVSFTVEPTKPGFVRVRYKIEEGPQWKIAKLAFPGATKVSEADLQKAAAIAPGTAWEGDVVERAAVNVSSLYYDRGFVNVRIETPRRDVAPDGAVTLTWPIQEGDRYTIGSLRFSGSPAEKYEKELLAQMKTREKTVFNRSVLFADLTKLRERFTKQGKKVEVTPLTKTNQKDKTIDIEIELKDLERKEP